MNGVSALVSSYWSHHRLADGDREQRLRAESGDSFWAWEAVEHAAREGAPDVLELFDALLAAPDADPCYVGAGPLEELLVHQGVAFEGAVAERCRRAERWRAAVSCVWLDPVEASRLSALTPFLPRAR